jgi:transcription initiation factor IIE alpha subunit
MSEKLLKFTCPKCGGHVLDQDEDNCFISSEIEHIRADGDFDILPPTIHKSSNYGFSCRNCNVYLKDENNYILKENLEVVEWIKKNCSQEEE